MTLAMIVFGAVVGGVGFRVRGGWLGEHIGWGIGTARIVAWALPMASIAALASLGEPWWLPLAVGAAAYLGAVLPTFNALDAGRNEGSILGDLAANAGRGALMALPLAAVVWLAGGDDAWMLIIAALAALSVPAGYELAWRVLPLSARPETAAECAIGAAFGGATAAAISLGIG